MEAAKEMIAMMELLCVVDPSRTIARGLDPYQGAMN